MPHNQTRRRLGSYHGMRSICGVPDDDSLTSEATLLYSQWDTIFIIS